MQGKTRTPGLSAPVPTEIAGTSRPVFLSQGDARHLTVTLQNFVEYNGFSQKLPKKCNSLTFSIWQL